MDTGEALAQVTPNTCQPRTEVRLWPNLTPSLTVGDQEGDHPLEKTSPCLPQRRLHTKEQLKSTSTLAGGPLAWSPGSCKSDGDNGGGGQSSCSGGGQGRAGKRRRGPGLALHAGPHPAPHRCLLTADQSLLLASDRCVPRAPIGRQGGSYVTRATGRAAGPARIPAPASPARGPRLNKNQGRELLQELQWGMRGAGEGGEELGGGGSCPGPGLSLAGGGRGPRGVTPRTLSFFGGPQRPSAPPPAASHEQSAGLDPLLTPGPQPRPWWPRGPLCLDPWEPFPCVSPRPTRRGVRLCQPRV